MWPSVRNTIASLSTTLNVVRYFVPIRWLQTRPRNEAIHETGFFGNQNTICKPTAPRWRTTVERLKQIFKDLDRA